jgi:hypothetical protein
MPNHHRGEVEGILDGHPYNLCLTLGALAELEAIFGDENMLALAQRFEGGKLSARDCVRIIGAGLRGAGHDITDAAVARMQAPGGIPGFIDIVARLLIATFGSSPSPRPSPGEGRGEGQNERERQAHAGSNPPPRHRESDAPHRRGEGRGGGLAAPTLANEVPAPVPFPGAK